MSKRFVYTLFTILSIGIIAAVAIFLAKGYRVSPQSGTVAGTGIISITSVPDQASVYLDGHLTTATNANVDSLPPKTYDVKVTKDGFIPWEKKVSVKEGLVSQIKVTLFPAIPTVYPLTYNGVSNVTLSPNGQRVAFIVPQDDITTASPLDNNSRLKRSGIWVWELLGNPLSFANGPEPHRVADLIEGVDYSKATLRWSPDSSQILITLPDRTLLLDESKLNDNGGQDISATATPTTDSWDQQTEAQNKIKLATIKNPNLREEASSAAFLKWSADETKFLYSKDGKTNFTVADIANGVLSTIEKASSVAWLPDSRHVVVVEDASSSPSPEGDNSFPTEKISVQEIDGSNKSEIYVGNFDPNVVFSWPDQSSLVFISSLPTPTASKPNLYGINIK